jgi:hypothetical protein
MCIVQYCIRDNKFEKIVSELNFLYLSLTFLVSYHVLLKWVFLQLPMQSVPITTKVARYAIQHYLIKFVSDLRQVGVFLRVLRFPPSMQLAATIWLKYRLSQVTDKLYHILLYRVYLVCHKSLTYFIT